MALKQNQAEELLAWYSTRRTIEIDIVGDFAGDELFAIHGESLIRHCLAQSKVDFTDGFQLLHAVYAVEKFLSDLRMRGCRFDIFFLRNMAHVCAPHGTSSTNGYKYRLARTIILQHLARADISSNIREFDSFEGDEFEEYLSGRTCHFVLCHEGEGDGGPGVVELRSLIWKLFNMGRQVAIINFTTWKISKPATKLTTAEWAAVAFCRSYLKHGRVAKHHRARLERVHALLLHTAALRVCSIQDRACESRKCSVLDRVFLQKFSEASQALIERWSGEEGTVWDLFDLVDGRVFSFMLEHVRRKEPISEAVVSQARRLWQEVLAADIPPPVTKSSLLSQLHTYQPSQSRSAGETPGILSFSHPAFNHFLKDVDAPKAQETTDPVAGLIYQDLKHWHVNKPIATSRNPEKPSSWAMKRHQRLMTSVTRYAESLQNLGGRTLERETITVSSHAPENPTKKGERASAAGGSQKKSKKQTNKKGGTENALKSAREIQERKARAKQEEVARFWAQTCVEYQKDRSLVGQYLKAEKFMCDRSKTDRLFLEPEIRLYFCHVLSKIWAKTREGVDQTSPKVKLSPKLVEDSRLLQLQHGGPYMERRFDSQPDPRVSFDPDAWQRKVLDSIDASESLLVVAPTSAGKTFISFYAMKKVLEESDDAVLVYVAPTKALVNQIAAEIEARFSKSYHGKGGKSVWGIHTRDYRINNPTGCQILVTVPHILQIMLLAPTNANKPNAWSHRVKRIIFDEVHCIGQAEDGVVWEQLLLLAPCPIIALSATVGNPLEFLDWLQMSQSRKKVKVNMVVHGFIYHPPSDAFTFTELIKAPRLPVPGLDEGNAISPNFKFVHPVRALEDRNREALDDVNLEARDCLSLWEKMKQVLPPRFQTDLAKLDPTRWLPEMVSKSDVVEWEKILKVVLRKAMETSGPSLKAVQASLDPRQFDDETIQTKATGIRKRFNHVDNLFPLVCELHSQDALPALVFNYDRQECERAVNAIRERLEVREQEWKDSSAKWSKKLSDFSLWQKGKGSVRQAEPQVRSKDKSGDDAKTSRLEMYQEAASAEISLWESFDPAAPLPQFSFADSTKMQRAEFEETIRGLQDRIPPSLIKALERGLGVHHAGMNRRYRQVGYLRVVVATGTLALGINMPCKTVVFSGDSIYLTSQNYRQASGRAGRRGFDLLGNVVFNGISETRVHNIMSCRLPDLKGQFPISTTLILRLFNLLHGTNNSEYAMNAVQALMSQTRLYLGGPDAEMAVKHHLRFSIEYLRRQDLISAEGAPINFTGMVTHLYFTENAAFAFHSLLRRGYFHKLCEDIDTSPERILLEIMLPDHTLPFTGTTLRSSETSHGGQFGCAPTTIRSPFVALSGLGDDFKSIQELCSTVRGGVFLEESAIPFIPIWPHDTDSELNAYLLDFYKHGSMADLEKNNRIRRGDVWFHLKDFSLVLKTIVTSLQSLVGIEGDLDADLGDEGDDDDDDDEAGWEQTDGSQEILNEEAPCSAHKVTNAAKKKTAEVVDNWDDDSDEDLSSAEEQTTDATKGPSCTSSDTGERGGLMNVLKAFVLLQDTFESKFKREWA
ncbi:hypothetical protein B0T10DRAFT_570328 [Thelonectria olida]|uniref:Helicase ATP-binding domain-containing protein n=1 Tax=Thelonectria olida TaxID=1576542 RepID=A0A9P9AW07_9HYPO|nr:hypothetical protein B0T10DRAFT_570328 [Thelonectria olida]